MKNESCRKSIHTKARFVEMYVACQASKSLFLSGKWDFACNTSKKLIYFHTFTKATTTTKKKIREAIPKKI